jgi:putative membrane protein
MSRHLFRWLITSVAVFLVPKVVTGVQIDNFTSALAVAAVLGLLNVLLRPILILFTLPLTLLSFGFFILILNAFLFQLAASFVSGFRVETFGAAFLASLFVTAVSWVLNLGFREDKGKKILFVHNSRGENTPHTRDLN